MTGNLKFLIKFVWKFLGTVCFGNDHVAAILGYDDLQCGNILIARVYYIEGLGHNLFSRLHLLHIDLCGLIRVENINGKRYVLVIVDDYSRYTWVHFLRSKDEALEEIKTFLKKITVLLQALVIINDHEDIRKLGAKGDIGFFIGYSTTSCAYRVYSRRTKKIIETMNVAFNELLAMAFEQRISKPGLQGMTSRQISSGLDLTYAPSTITSQNQLNVNWISCLKQCMMIILVVNR
ncbi:retrovirus-related pol polyprotein from transposon TNT 1-94 [Tanacetum coccineum]